MVGYVMKRIWDTANTFEGAYPLVRVWYVWCVCVCMCVVCYCLTQILLKLLRRAECSWGWVGLDYGSLGLGTRFHDSEAA
jgi:hypothetical protein